MDFTISKDALLTAIDKCQLATDKSHVSEAFRMMSIAATKRDSIGCAAVGEFCAVDTVAVADVKTHGRFNVMPGRLRDIANSMPAGRIQFTLKGTRVTVKSLVSSRKATFESHATEPFRVDDPGKEAAWLEADSQELLRALRCVKAASTWDNDNPVTSLLIPTNRGVDVYACNGYLVGLCETSIRFEGVRTPMQFPEKAAEVLALMAPEDKVVRIFSDTRRLYLENTDTLVSAALWEADPSRTAHPHIIGLLKNPDNLAGPTFSLPQLAQGVKSVLALSGFASNADKGSRGFQVHAMLGPETCTVELGFSEADARDEFDAERGGNALDFYLTSQFLEKMLNSLAPYATVQALRADNMLLLRSQGVWYGIMEEVKK
jgi:hypothetical protein